ncbi:tetratricopeptide repeat protein [Thiomicrorhabdus arctica]|uniref:tetratricopeptide repeat protein n=1 Tax=Thiomicrorhabdus arctica TaxID=131540 RepID=UPI00037467C5|nr:tetratricopeptide repeat protein [Thiomicrorhabdus arctica]
MTLKYSSNRTRIFQGMQFALISSLVLLSGCSAGFLTSSDSNVSGVALPASVTVEAPDDVLSKTPERSAHVDANTMFQILAAEMMVQKGQPAQAFDLIYEVALHTRDAELAERAFELSITTYDAKKIEAATILWREISPQAPIAWRASFLISLSQGSVDLALKQWHRYHSLSEEGLDKDLLLTAQRVSTSVRSDQSVVFMQSLTKDFPDSWAAYFSLGYVAQVHGQLDVALTALEKAKTLQTTASEPQINRQLVKLYLQLDSPQKGIDALKPYLKKYPEDWAVQEGVARLEVQAKHYDAAEARYEKILKSVPDAYTSRLSLALLQIERKSYAQAEVNLDQVMLIKGYTNVANYYLGLLHQEQNNHEKALHHFASVMSGNYYLDAQLHRAEIYFSMNDMAKAIKVLDLIDVDSPEDKIKVYRAKGVFYSYENEYTKAIEQYNKVLAIDSDHIEVLMAQALLFYKLEQFSAYERNLKHVIELAPNEVDALNALGYFYVEQNSHYEAAESLLKKAYRLAPKNYYVLDSLGWFYFQKKNYALAEEYLQKALAIQVDDEVLIHLISTYWKQGNDEKARALWLRHHNKFLQNKRLQGLIHELEKL